MNILVCSDLYPSSSHKIIFENIVKASKESGIEIKIIGENMFDGNLLTGKLDNEDYFISHNLSTYQALCSQVKDGDKVLFVDFFQPCLPLLKHYTMEKGFKVKFSSLFHGGSFVPGDIYSKYNWMESFDSLILDIMDQVFVPSSYSYKIVSNFIGGNSQKIKIRDFGYCKNELLETHIAKKKYDVVVPFRCSEDKGKGLILQIVNRCKDMSFIFSSLGWESFLNEENCFNENIYFIDTDESYERALLESKVAFFNSDQEFFGYSLREALQAGCIPVCPEKCCYPELLKKMYTFTNEQEAYEKIIKFSLYYEKYKLPPIFSSAQELVIDAFK